MKITKEVLKQIIDTVGTLEPESGGIIGRKYNVICSFFFDEGRRRAAEYSPDTEKLNLKIRQWEKEGIRFAGIVHSHPNGHNKLSSGDLQSISLILSCMNSLSSLYFLIVTKEKNEFSMTVYHAEKEHEEIRIKKVSYTVI